MKPAQRSRCNAFSSAARSPNGTATQPARRGSNGLRQTVAAHHGQSAQVRTVKAALAIDERRPARRRPRQLHARFNRLRATAGEQADRQRLGQQPGQSLGQVRCVGRRTHMTEIHRFFGQELPQTLSHSRVVMADVHRAEAGKKVQIPATVVVPNPDVAGADEQAAVAIYAEQSDEGRIDMPGILDDCRMICCGSRQTSSAGSRRAVLHVVRLRRVPGRCSFDNWDSRSLPAVRHYRTRLFIFSSSQIQPRMKRRAASQHC